MLVKQVPFSGSELFVRSMVHLHAVLVRQFYMWHPHPHPVLRTGNELQQLSRRTLSATLPACVCMCVSERERERQMERRDSAAEARAVIQITAVLSSSDTSYYLTCSFWFFISTTVPLDPLVEIVSVVVSHRLLLHEKERIEGMRERKKLSQTDRFQ